VAGSVLKPKNRTEIEKTELTFLRNQTILSFAKKNIFFE